MVWSCKKKILRIHKTIFKPIIKFIRVTGLRIIMQNHLHFYTLPTDNLKMKLRKKFHLEEIKNKLLRNTFNKKMQTLHHEKENQLLKENKKYLNKSKDTPSSRIWNFNIIKMAILKLVYRCNIISIRISAVFFFSFL